MTAINRACVITHAQKAAIDDLLPSTSSSRWSVMTAVGGEAVVIDWTNERVWEIGPDGRYHALAPRLMEIS